MAGPGFAVLDFETTGIFSAATDRVVELAVVHVSDRGVVEGRWETLVNPRQRIVGSDGHGLRSADVRDAPTFAEVAPQLVDLLRGRVVVAHNASLTIRFLLAELSRAGQAGPADVVSLCTMQLARDFLPGAGRSLADCCAALDIDLDGARCAAVDALATARLLAAYIEAADAPEFWTAHLGAAAGQPWPAATEVPGSRRAAPAPPVAWCARTVSSHPLAVADFLERLVLRLPDAPGPAEYVDYLALLDHCLLAGTVEGHDARALTGLAAELGLGRTVCAELHRQYFDAVTALAWSDGILTARELTDLASVGALLSQPAETVAAALDETRHLTTPALPMPAAGTDVVLWPGDLVVLTGAMGRTRGAWERELRERGLVPWGAVTKQVRLLVAADVHSLSGKARKARDYGIPIVDESTLARLAGAQTTSHG